MPLSIESFWRRYCNYSGVEHTRPRATRRFWTDPALSEHLTRMIALGTKRAASGPMRGFGGKEPRPKTGDYSILVDHQQRPRVIWRTSSVVVGPLCNVTEAFVWRHGSGDGSRQDWLRITKQSLEREAMSSGFEMHDDIETLFQTFEVVWPPGAARNAKLLGPRLDRGLELIDRLQVAQAEADDAERFMASIETAVLVLDSSLRVRRTNPSAEMLLRRGDGLQERNGQLSARWPNDERALWAAVRKALDARGTTLPLHDAGPASRASCLLLARDDDRPPYRASIFPLPGEGRPLAVGKEGRVILLVEDPDKAAASIESEVEFLMRAFRLTGAEARIAVRIGLGASLPDVADALGIARSTAKTHLDRIFDKLNVRRQAELVRLLRTHGSLQLNFAGNQAQRR